MSRRKIRNPLRKRQVKEKEYSFRNFLKTQQATRRAINKALKEYQIELDIDYLRPKEEIDDNLFNETETGTENTDS